MSRKPCSLSWSVEDAFEVAEVLKSAALDGYRNVRDCGFWEDAQSLYQQIEAVEKRGACCDNEERSMAGGCINCGDPCF